MIRDSHADKSAVVRLRLNHATTSGPWEFAEWDFGAALPRIPSCGPTPLLTVSTTTSTASDQWPLKDQIKLKANILDTDEYKRYKDLWNIQSRGAPSGGIAVPECLEDVGVRRYALGSLSMSTLEGVCAADGDIRKTLALQQCSFCHSL